MQIRATTATHPSCKQRCLYIAENNYTKNRYYVTLIENWAFSRWAKHVSAFFKPKKTFIIPSIREVGWLQQDLFTWGAACDCAMFHHKYAGHCWSESAFHTFMFQHSWLFVQINKDLCACSGDGRAEKSCNSSISLIQPRCDGRLKLKQKSAAEGETDLL